MADDGDAGVKQEAKIISLIVKDQHGTEVMFKVKPHTKLGKVFSAYCQKKSLQNDAVRFLFEGNRVLDDQTPEQLDMEDGDHLDCVQNQVGGC
mmetsp:Transcript_31201/g.79545  ORF Transcript_31201/g.79545 Transcript_31201/m.79545 type:complete len:93 (+) Transcript_31201:163-441(+)|eukprot:CAMPEP_0202866912 /NCGR_PEP_ID=MMETSP1391-20130828/8428_1 /ASSEMBLY_ACC=CAM_ASM_000867 /TAXON_ID=1034604 /ORGANISM="Chlamydomonas leiostraca, Strain SAG 11-49" /LENGTH=92 /DNA_ID=CAMNT_0049546901 /DNA_START=163 /DNA_END=441 /DNA_ORIENTATION=+